MTSVAESYWYKKQLQACRWTLVLMSSQPRESKLPCSWGNKAKLHHPFPAATCVICQPRDHSITCNPITTLVTLTFNPYTFSSQSSNQLISSHLHLHFTQSTCFHCLPGILSSLITSICKSPKFRNPSHFLNLPSLSVFRSLIPMAPML